MAATPKKLDPALPPSAQTTTEQATTEQATTEQATTEQTTTEQAPADPPVSVRQADAVRAAARLAKVAGSALAEVELTLPQYRVLVFLVDRSRPANDVAALLGVTASTVTSVVDGLVARELVTRSVDAEDRRRVVLSLTPLGYETVALGDRVVGAGLDRLLRRLEPDQAETALVGLELLNRAMEAALDERFGAADRLGTVTAAGTLETGPL